MHRLFLAAALAVVPVAAFGQGARDNIDALIEQQAKANGVPASFVHAVVKRESNYNPKAKGGSALGLMQIKHATARSLGYTGDAAGLYDPATNLRYGVAYLAGAYRTAQGNVSQAYQYYNRGYYYAAKRQGISTEVAAVVAPVAASASALASLFGGGVTDPGAASGALAYAPTAAAVAAVPSETVEVPLPPRRPDALSGSVTYAKPVRRARRRGCRAGRRRAGGRGRDRGGSASAAPPGRPWQRGGRAGPARRIAPLTAGRAGRSVPGRRDDASGGDQRGDRDRRRAAAAAPPVDPAAGRRPLRRAPPAAAPVREATAIPVE
nr:transglycosylase SLT domain-containing protein [Methylobacterium sp. WL1]